MGNPFSGFMMMPFMPGMQEPQQQGQVQADIVVPARVRVAMEYLNSLTIKTMPRAAVSESMIQEIPGQHLSDEEVGTQATACSLLSQYFAGKLNPDAWEKLKVDALKKQVSGRNQRGMILNCIMCNNSRKPKKDCPLCQGTGAILVVGAQPQEQEEADVVEES